VLLMNGMSIRVIIEANWPDEELPYNKATEFLIGLVSLEPNRV
jgi:hypothetical protein